MKNRELRKVERQFFVAILGLVAASIVGFGAILYESNAISFNRSIDSDGLSGLISDDPAVVEYVEQEKDFEAHFITIANLVKQDQQQSLTNALLVVTIGSLIVATVAGYFIARYLLRPVRESFESQERFVQDAAHELRNPLAAISVALQGAPSKISQTQFYKTVNRQTKRLIGINEDLLFLERRSYGKDIGDVNVSDLLRDVLEDLQPEIARKQQKITTRISNDIVKTMDANDFVKLAKNIISNSIKYSGDKSNISVSLKSTDSKVKLIVKDDGIGIPEEELKNIGQRFYRAKNVGNKTGTGLGMSIVNKVTNIYGGNLNITSQEGKGTTVIVEL